jgi:ATP phosphoribosyltransferase
MMVDKLMFSKNDGIRIALPRGNMRNALGELLARHDFVVDGYLEGSRVYRFEVNDRPDLQVRVFSDADIPIQVALGNYDLAICSRTWVDELLTRYQHNSIISVKNLDLQSEPLVVAGAEGSNLEAIASSGVVRVATEYPNLADHYLRQIGIPNYRLFDVWAQAESWPPDDAELAIGPKNDLLNEGLKILAEVHSGGVCLIANRESIANNNLSSALDVLTELPQGRENSGLVQGERITVSYSNAEVSLPERETFRIAVPDGHAQRHTVESLSNAGIDFEGYSETISLRRPVSLIPGVEVKVMRPQDMPRAVALGNFDLALTGQDWLQVFLSSFPSAPIVQLCDLRRSEYKLGAVVSDDLPAKSISEAINYWRKDDSYRTIRLASEYASLADQYARDNQLGRYRVIPLTGASEGFVPEDAEILIEGTETGTTLRANNLSMIDVIMNSTNCAIGHMHRPSGWRGEMRDEFVDKLNLGADFSD